MRWGQNPSLCGEACQGKGKICLFLNALKFPGISEGVGLMYAPTEGGVFDPYIDYTHREVNLVQNRSSCTQHILTFSMLLSEGKSKVRIKCIFALTCAVCLPCHHEDSCSPAPATFPMNLNKTVWGFSRKKSGLISVLYWLCRTHSFMHRIVIHDVEQAQEPFPPTDRHVYRPMPRHGVSTSFLQHNGPQFPQNLQLYQWLWACTKPWSLPVV